MRQDLTQDLFQAISQGCVIQCSQCLREGARLHRRNTQGETPVQMARRLRHRDIIHLIRRTERMRHVRATILRQKKRNRHLDSLGAERRRPYLRF